MSSPPPVRPTWTKDHDRLSACSLLGGGVWKHQQTQATIMDCSWYNHFIYTTHTLFTIEIQLHHRTQHSPKASLHFRHHITNFITHSLLHTSTVRWHYCLLLKQALQHLSKRKYIPWTLVQRSVVLLRWTLRVTVSNCTATVCWSLSPASSERPGKGR